MNGWTLYDWVMDYLPFIVEMLLAALLFLLPLEKRSRWVARAALGAAVCLLAAMVLPHIFLRYFLEFLTVAAFVWWCCSISAWDALYCAVCAYAAQHLAFCLHVLASRVFAFDVLSHQLLKLPCYGGVYLLAYFLIARKLPDRGHYRAGVQRSLLSMAVVLSFTLLLSYYVTRNLFSANPSPFAYACLLYAMLCCGFALWVQASQQRQTRLTAEVETERRLRLRQQEQYELSRENIDLINRKCHDLKHQVSALRAVDSEEAREASLREIEESVMIYDSVVKTGNEVLDTVLTEKSLLCEKRGISWTCMADGSRLGFLDAVDLYTLFGNALDNAIESVSALTDADKRIIAVTLYSRDALVLLQIENYYSHPIAFADGLPVTTKGGDHGYGMKSIRATVEKYGGSMTIRTEEDVFILCVMLPQP